MSRVIYIHTGTLAYTYNVYICKAILSPCYWHTDPLFLTTMHATASAWRESTFSLLLLTSADDWECCLNIIFGCSAIFKDHTKHSLTGTILELQLQEGRPSGAQSLGERKYLLTALRLGELQLQPSIYYNSGKERKRSNFCADKALSVPCAVGTGVHILRIEQESL